jgi:hypothetical protein
MESAKLWDHNLKAPKTGAIELNLENLWTPQG